MYSRPFDRELPDAGEDRPLGHPPVANHLPAALLVADVPAFLDPVFDFRFEGLGRHLLCTLAIERFSLVSFALFKLRFAI